LLSAALHPVAIPASRQPIPGLELLTAITHMKTAKIYPLVLALFATVFPLLGCGSKQGKKDAEATLIRHFQIIATNGFEFALADYGANFFQTTPKDEWVNALKGMNRKFGTYQHHTITNLRMVKKAGRRGAGTTISIQCQVTYSKHPATEIFTLFKGITDSDYKIVGHQVNSTAWMVE
jgi:hypothetical protein